VAVEPTDNCVVSDDFFSYIYTELGACRPVWTLDIHTLCTNTYLLITN